MARNIYFSQAVKTEQDLYEDIIIESLKIYGQDVYYLPREIVNEDNILGDANSSRFSSKYKLEMYIENTEGFDGEGDLFTKFGVEIRDQATFVVSRRRWNNTIGAFQSDTDFVRPREGDLIYLPLTNKMFQIMHVEHEQPFYQLSNLPTYKLRCELFEYSSEDFDTSIDPIDNIERSYAYQYLLTLDSGSYGYPTGITVNQILSSGVTISGEVAAYRDSSNTLTLIHVGADDGNYHEFVDGRKIESLNVVKDGYKSKSLVTAVGEDNKLSENEQNSDFELEADGFLDFTETNPFGDPNEV